MASQPYYSPAEMAAFNKAKQDKRRSWLETEYRRNPRCFYCKNKTELLPRGANSKIRQVPGTFHATLDHAQPLALGGVDHPANYRLCCNTCNNLKADMPEREYIALLVREGIR